MTYILRVTRFCQQASSVGRRLASPDVRNSVAEAILVAVQRLYLPPDLDMPTGQMRLPVLSQYLVSGTARTNPLVAPSPELLLPL